MYRMQNVKLYHSEDNTYIKYIDKVKNCSSKNENSYEIKCI